jgi:Smg protein
LGDRILEIVFYLVQYVRTHDGSLAHLDDISKSLKNLGFTESEISSAYGWFLEEVQSRSEKFVFTNDLGNCQPRVFSELERQQIDPAAQGYLIQIHQMGLLSDEEFEVTVERAMMMAPDQVDLAGMKMITSTVLFGSTSPSMDLNWFNVSGDETVH